MAIPPPSSRNICSHIGRCQLACQPWYRLEYRLTSPVSREEGGVCTLVLEKKIMYQLYARCKVEAHRLVDILAIGGQRPAISIVS